MLFTIGYSTRALDEFFAELENHNITSIIDVRSSPRSRNPAFNRQRLEVSAELLNVKYNWEGHALGGRSAFSPGHALYDRALQKLVSLSVEDNIALLCAEGEPEKCHRCYDIGAALLSHYGLHSYNIRRDGSVEDVLTSLHRLPAAQFQKVRHKMIARA